MTLSATEAKFGAMTAGVRDTLWIRDLMTELHHPPSLPTPVWVDNSAAVQISKDPIVNSKTRHVAVNMHFVREQQNDTKMVKVMHCSAEGQIADYLTKNLGRPQLLKNIALAGQDLPKHPPSAK